MYYLHIEDSIKSCIGPFDTAKKAQDYFDWSRKVRNDPAVLIAINTEPADDEEFDIDPEFDKVIFD